MFKNKNFNSHSANLFDGMGLGYLLFNCCCRIGILSMTRPSSRMSHAKGLRSFTFPSLPINTQTNPLGLKELRRALSKAGSVSITIIKSRSAAASKSLDSNSIWALNVGSSGLFANITSGLADQITSLRSTSEAANIRCGSASHESLVAPAKAGVVKAMKVVSAVIIRMVMKSPLHLYIGAFLHIAKGTTKKLLGFGIFQKENNDE